MTDRLFDLDAYLERINYSGRTDATEETLRDLHMAHTLNVPFENLDVFNKKPILLDETSLYHKIVEKRRGGYCFEMNGVFSIALQRLGFKARNILARVTRDGVTYTAKTHQAILVEIDNRNWVADVGFGNEGILAPLILEKNLDQQQFAHTYRLIQDPQYGWVLQKKAGDDYNHMYALYLDECYPMDFMMSNHFTSTHPDSFFTQMRMCTMPTKEGRVTLTDHQLKIATNGDVKETAIANEDQYKELLQRYFKLDLDAL